MTHQIQGQPTREEPPNPPNLNRALAPCPPPVADRNDPVDLTQDDSDSEENKKAELLAHSTNPNSDKGIARLSHDPQSTSGHQSKASAGPLYGDDQRDELHNQPQADATPPNENKRLHGTTTGASDSQMTKRPITSFEDCLVALKAFKETSGHTNVQLRDDPGLAKFCDDLRWARSNPGRGLAVTDERVAALDELGFDWKGAEKQIKQADRNSEPQEEDNSGKSRAVPDGSLAAGSSLSNDKTIEPEEKAPVNSGRIKLGTKVSKMFVDNDRRRSFLGSGECRQLSYKRVNLRRLTSLLDFPSHWLRSRDETVSNRLRRQGHGRLVRGWCSCNNAQKKKAPGQTKCARSDSRKWDEETRQQTGLAHAGLSDSVRWHTDVL